MRNSISGSQEPPEGGLFREGLTGQGVKGNVFPEEEAVKANLWRTRAGRP